jgi:hypothetical protein
VDPEGVEVPVLEVTHPEVTEAEHEIAVGVPLHDHLAVEAVEIDPLVPVERQGGLGAHDTCAVAVPLMAFGVVPPEPGGSEQIAAPVAARLAEVCVDHA